MLKKDVLVVPITLQATAGVAFIFRPLEQLGTTIEPPLSVFICFYMFLSISVCFYMFTVYLHLVLTSGLSRLRGVYCEANKT